MGCWSFTVQRNKKYSIKKSQSWEIGEEYKRLNSPPASPTSQLQDLFIWFISPFWWFHLHNNTTYQHKLTGTNLHVKLNCCDRMHTTGLWILQSIHGRYNYPLAPYKGLCTSMGPKGSHWWHNTFCCVYCNCHYCQHTKGIIHHFAFLPRRFNENQPTLSFPIFDRWFLSYCFLDFHLFNFPCLHKRNSPDHHIHFR